MFKSLLLPRLSFLILSLFLLFAGRANSDNPSSKNIEGMDFLIISTSTKGQQEYWEQHLNKLRGKLIKNDAYLLVIHEQWPGGAGNGFGTLHAYSEGMKKARELYNIDLLEFQKQGHSVAIYHTSGQGKRMQPLTASEKNNKSAVKLPTGIPYYSNHTISILEAVILQSSSLAENRKGRVSVFWGDQIFLPANPIKEQTPFDIDIYAKGRPMPNEALWQADGLEKYGFFASSPEGTSCYLEKASFRTIQELIKDQKIASDKDVAISLGSFSLSAPMIAALLEEFSDELEAKNEMMNVEHSLWMPLTLDVDHYTQLMISMGWSKEKALNQFDRLSAFKTRFIQKNPESKLFGVTDIGYEGFWWDYGTIDNYYNSIQKLIKEGPETKAMRDFYQISCSGRDNNSQLEIDDNSIVLGCSIHEGIIKNSIIIGVNAKSVNFDNVISLSSDFNSIHASNCLYYNVFESDELFSHVKHVRADLFLNNSKDPIKISTELGRDGKADWEKKINGNKFSYAELEKLNIEDQ